MGYGKPYVMVVPHHKMKVHTSFGVSRERHDIGIDRARNYKCLHPSAWCITEDPGVILEAIDRVVEGNTCIYDNGWRDVCK